MLDILVPALLLDLADWTGEPAAVDGARLETGVGFTGCELTGQLGTPARTVAALQAACTATTVSDALQLRGAVIIGGGYAGVTLGSGAVLEPAGRRWALIHPTAERYSWAGLLPSVTYTMRRP